MITVLVCGSRDYTDIATVDRVLDELHAVQPITLLVDGAASGADTLGYTWALKHGVATRRYPADWHRFGRAAGPLRNARMLELERPDLVVAFCTKPLTESRGTADMIRRARDETIPCTVHGADDLEPEPYSGTLF